MREIEIFIKLIDENESDKIMDYFKEKPVGSKRSPVSLEIKKKHIYKIFKSMTPNIIKQRKKGGQDPFFSYINKYKISIDKTDSFQDMSLLLFELKGKFPTYTRYSYLLVRFPEETRAIQDKIEENIEKGQDPLYNLNPIESIEKLKLYLRKSRDFIGENRDKKIISLLEPYQNENYKVEINKCKNEIIDKDLLDLYHLRESLYDKYNVAIVNIAYIETHPSEEEDIKLLLLFEAMFNLIKEYKVDVNEIVIHENKLLIKRLENKEDEFKKNERTILKLNSTMEKNTVQLNNIIKKNELLKEGNLILTRELQSEKTSNLDKYLKVEKEIIEINEEKIKNEIDYKLNIKKLKKEIEKQNFIINERKRVFNNFSGYPVDWGIICVSDYLPLIETFPEISIAHAENQIDCEKMMNDSSLNKIYIIMRGLNTRKYHSLKKSITKQIKKFDSLHFNDFKETVDWIGYKKTKEKGVYK